jgi:hypothetical protein
MMQFHSSDVEGTGVYAGCAGSGVYWWGIREA